MLFGTLKPTQEVSDANDLSFSDVKNKVYHQLYQWIEVYGQTKVLALLCIVTVTAFFFRNAARYFAQYYLVALRTGVSRKIRNDLFNKILNLPVFYFTDKRKGDLMARVSADVAEVEYSLLAGIIELARAPFMIVTTLITLFYIDYQLTLFALIVFPLMGTIISLIGKSLKKDAKSSQKQLGLLFSLVEETLGAAKIIKIFNAEKHLSQKYWDYSTHWRSLETRVQRKKELSSPISEFLGSITMILIVWFAGKLIIEGQGMKPEVFLGFIGLFFQLIEPSKAIAQALSGMQKGGVSAQRIFEVLDTDIKIKEAANPIVINEIKHGIHFENVSFRYDDSRWVIRNFNLFIPKGKSVALVGKSGSGKTTIANLIARFYDVTSGRITVDGIDIRDLDLKSYRKLIGMVTQESVLFNDTIFNNITLGQTNASLHDVVMAAKTANADEFISQLPEGYNTTVGEGGNKLSGGQKQRIAIARAILKNPPLMILDEATSALDTQSERLVQTALENMMESRTSLIIAHRLSTIQNADIIVVMNKGEIIEMGSHSELVQQDNTYARLIEMQNLNA